MSRFIHEIHGTKPQSSVGGRSYGAKVTEPPGDFPGFKVELFAVDIRRVPSGEILQGGEGDVIEIHGNGREIRFLLSSWLAAVDHTEQRLREAWEEEKARIRQCPDCGCWVVPERHEEACGEIGSEENQRRGREARERRAAEPRRVEASEERVERAIEALAALAGDDGAALVERLALPGEFEGQAGGVARRRGEVEVAVAKVVGRAGASRRKT